MSFIKISHRGANKKAVENTISAFEEAYKLGIRYFEADIRMTKDKKAVLFHNSSLKGLCKKNKALHLITLEEFSKLDCRGDKPISLEEFFKHFKGRVKFNLEIKVRGAIDEITRLIQKHRLENDVIISSFRGPIIKKCKERLPSVKTGQLSLFGNGAILKAKQYKADIVIIHNLSLKKYHIRRAHKHKLPIWTWPVNTKKRIEKLEKWGVDGIITDIPEIFD